MASTFVPDIWAWISSLPPLGQWSTNTISLRICSSKPSMNLSATKSPPKSDPFISFSICADFNVPISLWASNPIYLKAVSQCPLDEQQLGRLCNDVIDAVLKYGPCRRSSSMRTLMAQIKDGFRDVFNLAFLTLSFLVCVYEAPRDLRSGCLEALGLQLFSARSKEPSKLLLRSLGGILEEQWMRSLNLAATNWMSDNHGLNLSLKTQHSPLLSYAVSTSGLWKVQLYCPVMAMSLEDPCAATNDERLLFSLKYQQLEGVIQLSYRVFVKENWIDVAVSVDNVRCDVNPLVSETLMSERGWGSEEKHFPSRISLQLTPTLHSDVLSVSVSKSSDNPVQEVGLEKALEGSFDPPGAYIGLKVSAAETITMSMKPWKFEQSVYGDSANLHWFLHDGVNGREVFSSRPSKLSTLLQPRAWYRDRYSSAYRPFTKQGGVIFAGDEYGEKVWWKLCRRALGKTMEWEIKGWIWLTYWPNKQRTFHSETRRLQVKELLHLPLPKVADC